MKMGEVIRHYRRAKNMTQEEMANRLGVSAPAVNKWENDRSYPDITLLAPIARLLGVTLEELLSFKSEPTDAEIACQTERINQILKTDDFAGAYDEVRKAIDEYPQCGKLIIRLAVILDIDRMMHERILPQGFEAYIESLYRRAVQSTDEGTRILAADMLLEYELRQQKYAEAEACLAYYSVQNPERKRKQARIALQKGDKEKAYRISEEMLLEDYQHASASLESIYMLAMQDNDLKKAHRVAEKQSELAKIFEMGKYYEVCFALELAAKEKNRDAVLEIAETMLNGAKDPYAFTNADLYAHLPYKKPKSDFEKAFVRDLKKRFAEDEAFDFLRNDPRWKQLLTEQ